jgi:hypothetical protein
LTTARALERGARADTRSTVPAVVHLVRAANGIAPLRRFLDSYVRYPAGTEHELVLLFKGFASAGDAAPYMELADDLDARALFVEDEGFDLTAYRVAASSLGRSCYCFLNSFSVILAADWLKLMHGALLAPGVGLIGATGSGGSIRSYARFMLGLGGPYAEVMPDRRSTVRTLEAVAARHAAGAPRGDRSARIPGITFASALVDQATGFLPFPALHLRTNAFMIQSQVFERLRMTKLRSKNDAYRLESGRHSITAQVERMGLDALVVGRDGHVYGKSDWYASRTFWQGEQENLLIADKQTADYQLGDAHTRTVLSRYAWGALAHAATVRRPAGTPPESS